MKKIDHFQEMEVEDKKRDFSSLPIANQIKSRSTLSPDRTSPKRSPPLPFKRSFKNVTVGLIISLYLFGGVPTLLKIFTGLFKFFDLFKQNSFQ